jgi:hypothetical protein
MDDLLETDIWPRTIRHMRESGVDNRVPAAATLVGPVAVRSVLRKHGTFTNQKWPTNTMSS